MTGVECVLLAVGATVGAFVRYALTGSPLLFHALPLNILIVNVLGAFLLGAFVVLFQQWNLDARYALVVAVGFCGSLTTMSSFALESVDLLDHSLYLTWAIHMLANVGLSIGALLGGKTLTQAILAS